MLIDAGRVNAPQPQLRYVLTGLGYDVAQLPGRIFGTGMQAAGIDLQDLETGHGISGKPNHLGKHLKRRIRPVQDRVTINGATQRGRIKTQLSGYPRQLVKELVGIFLRKILGQMGRNHPQIHTLQDLLETSVRIGFAQLNQRRLYTPLKPLQQVLIGRAELFDSHVFP